MLFIEFIYNKSVYFTINYSHFKIVYDFNHLSPLHLIPLLVDKKVSLDDNKKTHVLKAFNESI
jgi:hypothetical protein